MSGFHDQVSTDHHRYCSFIAGGSDWLKDAPSQFSVAVKMTGKIGPYGIGILNVLTNKFEDDEPEMPEADMFREPRTNYSVVRVNRDVLAGSTVGGIFVNKQDADTYNRTAGLDFSFRPTREIDVKGLWSQTFEPDVLGNSNAFYFGTNWRTNLFQLDGSYTDIGEDFNPEVGFVLRKGVRRLQGFAQYTPWPRKFGIREIQIGPEMDIVLTRENELETQDITFDTQFSLEAGDSIGSNSRIRRKISETNSYLKEKRFQAASITLPHFKRQFAASSSRMIFGEVRLELGQFYHGSRSGLLLDATFRPSAKFSIEPFIEFNRITFQRQNSMRMPLADVLVTLFRQHFSRSCSHSGAPIGMCFPPTFW